MAVVGVIGGRGSGGPSGRAWPAGAAVLLRWEAVWGRKAVERRAPSGRLRGGGGSPVDSSVTGNPRPRSSSVTERGIPGDGSE